MDSEKMLSSGITAGLIGFCGFGIYGIVKNYKTEQQKAEAKVEAADAREQQLFNEAQEILQQEHLYVRPVTNDAEHDARVKDLGRISSVRNTLKFYYREKDNAQVRKLSNLIDAVKQQVVQPYSEKAAKATGQTTTQMKDVAATKKTTIDAEVQQIMNDKKQQLAAAIAVENQRPRMIKIDTTDPAKAAQEILTHQSFYKTPLANESEYSARVEDLHLMARVKHALVVKQKDVTELSQLIRAVKQQVVQPYELMLISKDKQYETIGRVFYRKIMLPELLTNAGAYNGKPVKIMNVKVAQVNSLDTLSISSTSTEIADNKRLDKNVISSVQGNTARSLDFLLADEKDYLSCHVDNINQNTLRDLTLYLLEAKEKGWKIAVYGGLDSYGGNYLAAERVDVGEKTFVTVNR